MSDASEYKCQEGGAGVDGAYHRPKERSAAPVFHVNYNRPDRQGSFMSLSLEHDCPECGETREFYRAASTEMHLGTKEKWGCPECEYGFVTIDSIDSSAATA